MACVSEAEGEARIFSRIQMSVAVSGLVVDGDKRCGDVRGNNIHLKLAFEASSVEFSSDRERHTASVREAVGKGKLESVFDPKALVRQKGRDRGLCQCDLHLARGVDKGGRPRLIGRQANIVDFDVHGGRFSVVQVGGTVFEEDAVGDNNRPVEGMQRKGHLVTEVVLACQGQLC